VLNNPLKYTDPSGEVHTVPFAQIQVLAIQQRASGSLAGIYSEWSAKETQRLETLEREAGTGRKAIETQPISY
jgi:hypothetical protein